MYTFKETNSDDSYKILKQSPNASIFTNPEFIKSLKNIIDFNNHSLVQFYHRNLAYLITVYIIALSIYIYKKNLKNLYNPIKLLLISLILQVSLGILTLISGLNIYLASAHQICSVILVFSSINLYYFHIK